MELRPSDIYYSQDSINGYFDSKSNHCNIRIGETLDAICERRCSVSDIPTISVIRHNGKWLTADNRRLWVLRHLERLGKCSTVQVYQTYRINPMKMTSMNGGVSVVVRGDPGGRWHKKRPPATQLSDNYSLYGETKPASSTSYTGMTSGRSAQRYGVSPRVDYNSYQSYRQQTPRPQSYSHEENKVEEKENIIVRFFRWLLS